jgi:hypothetical protein
LFQSRKYKVNVVGLVSVDDCHPRAENGLLYVARFDSDAKEPTVVIQRREKTRLGVLGSLLNLLGMSAYHEERRNERKNWLPLDEIEVKKPEHNRRLVADFSYWFHSF